MGRVGCSGVSRLAQGLPSGTRPPLGTDKPPLPSGRGLGRGSGVDLICQCHREPPFASKLAPTKSRCAQPAWLAPRTPAETISPLGTDSPLSRLRERVGERGSSRSCLQLAAGVAFWPTADNRERLSALRSCLSPFREKGSWRSCFQLPASSLQPPAGVMGIASLNPSYGAQPILRAMALSAGAGGNRHFGRRRITANGYSPYEAASLPSERGSWRSCFQPPASSGSYINAHTASDTPPAKPRSAT